MDWPLERFYRISDDVHNSGMRAAMSRDQRILHAEIAEY